MTTSVKTILSSHIPAEGGRSRTITTLLVTYPLWIYGQMHAHRIISTDETGNAMANELEYFTPSVMDCKDISRNASSNRAVPATRLMAEVSVNPAIPNFFGAEQRGMQAHELCNNPVIIDGELYSAEEAWQLISRKVVEYAGAFATAGYHKQVVNRLMMPWQHITVVMTATDWEDFLRQRVHKDADPAMFLLADLIREELAKPAMQTLEHGQMHLPFVEDSDWEDLLARYGIAATPQRIASFKRSSDNTMTIAANTAHSILEQSHVARPAPKIVEWIDDPFAIAMIKLSVARCASASYNTVDGFRMDGMRSGKLYTRLAGADPMHLSPFEHQAVMMPAYNTKLNGNFADTVIQYRKLVEMLPQLREI